jgi:arylsulfatase A-like enzyme
LPTFVAAAGNPNITDELLKGKQIGDRTYKNHLDGYDQTAMLTGKGPSNRHEIFYFGESDDGTADAFFYAARYEPHDALMPALVVEAHAASSKDRPTTTRSLMRFFLSAT